MQNENQFIKITDEKLANTLRDSGFSYITENNKKQTLYVFPFNSKLYELIESVLTVPFGESGQIVCENKLRF